MCIVKIEILKLEQGKWDQLKGNKAKKHLQWKQQVCDKAIKTDLVRLTKI